MAKDADFDVANVDMTDIKEGENYYGGFTFVSSVAEQYAKRGLQTSYADASHMEAKGPSTYGTFYEIGAYSQNFSLLAVVAGHGIAAESGDEWSTRFAVAAAIPGFDVKGRVIVVDLEKGLDTAVDQNMKSAGKFNDELHVIKNMSKKLGPGEKATGPALYSRALRAPSMLEVEVIKQSYGAQQHAYLSKFSDKELYRAHSPGLEDTIVTSQAAESAMSAAQANKIRLVEPMAMLKNLAEAQGRKFNAQQVLSCVPSELGAVALGVSFAWCMLQVPVST